MSETSRVVLEETARDYAGYATVNMNNELKSIYDSIEEMQLRLEEFTSIAGMMQAKGDKSVIENLPRYRALRPQLNNLCKRIDALDFFVTRVNLDLATLEANMDLAESSLGMTENKFAMLNPFSFFKKPADTTSSLSSPQPNYRATQTFKLDDYFKNES